MCICHYLSSQKAYRSITQNSNWEKEVEVCKTVASQAVDLANIHIQCAKGKGQQEQIRLLSAAKLMLRGAFIKVQVSHINSFTAKGNNTHLPRECMEKLGGTL